MEILFWGIVNISWVYDEYHKHNEFIIPTEFTLKMIIKVYSYDKF